MGYLPTGYLPTGYLPTGYLPPGPAPGPPVVVLYVPPSATGWRSTARRRGPDPDFTTAARRGGRGD